MRNERGWKRLDIGILSGITVLSALFAFDMPLGWAQSQAGGGAQQPPAAAPQSFEVASIKPSAPVTDGRMMVRMETTPGGRWNASGVTVSMLIQQAYDVRSYQIIGGPGWLNTERYDIVAKAETPDINRESVRVLLQSLLAERFNLQTHRETKELPIYELVIGKDGHKLKKSEVQPDTPPETPPADAGRAAQPGGAPRGNFGAAPASAPPRGASMIRMGRGQLNAQGIQISGITQMLAQQLGRPVIDKTDIKGNYDFNLQWTPDETQRGIGIAGMDRPAADSPLPADTSGPSLFTAVQEQLGLKLEASKGPVETLVIDRVEKASGN